MTSPNKTSAARQINKLMRSLGIGAACGMAIGVIMAAMPTANPALTRAGTPDERVGGAKINTGLILARMAKNTHSGAVINVVNVSAVIVNSSGLDSRPTLTSQC